MLKPCSGLCAWKGKRVLDQASSTEPRSAGKTDLHSAGRKEGTRCTAKNIPCATPFISAMAAPAPGHLDSICSLTCALTTCESWHSVCSEAQWVQSQRTAQLRPTHPAATSFFFLGLILKDFPRKFAEVFVNKKRLPWEEISTNSRRYT